MGKSLRSKTKLQNIAKLFVIFIAITAMGLQGIVHADTEEDVDFGLSSNPSSSLSFYGEDMALYAEKDSYQLLLDNSSGDFVIKSTKTNAEWKSNPDDRGDAEGVVGINKFIMYSQISIVVYDPELGSKRTMVSRTNSVLYENGLTVEPLTDGFRLNYSFPADTNSDGITPEPLFVPVDVELKNQGRLSVSVDVTKIKDFKDRKIIEISLLPFMGSGGVSNEGYLFLPDGSGTLAYFNNNKVHTSPYAQSVYGLDGAKITDYSSEVTESARLPVFGIQKDGVGMMGVISDGDAAATIHGYTSGMVNNQNTAYASFELYPMDMVPIGGSNFVQEFLKYDFERVRIDRLSVDYYFLEEEQSGYTGMARKYREILQQQGVSSANKKTDPYLYLELFGGYRKKSSFLGIPITKRISMTTFSQANEIVDELRTQKIDNLSLLMTNWSEDESKGKVQNKVRAMKNLGGANGLVNLFSALKNDSVDLSLSFNPVSISDSGYGYGKKLHAAKKLSQERIALYSYKPNIYFKDTRVDTRYVLRFPKVEKAVQSFRESLNKKYKGIGLYNEDLATLLYSDYSNGSNYLSRQSMKAKVTEMMDSMDMRWTLKQANAYLLPYAGTIVSVPTSSSQYQLSDQDVPFYQLAVSGLIDYTLPSINLSQDTTHQSFLKALETGSHMYLQLAAGDVSEFSNSTFDEMYSADYQRWKEDVITVYKKLTEAFDQLGSMVLVDHKQLADDVILSTYQGGSRVIINYSKNSFVYEGKTVAAESYIVLY